MGQVCLVRQTEFFFRALLLSAIGLGVLTATDTVSSSGSYYIVVPVGPSGIGFLGDADKFVSLGKKRIAQLVDNGTVQATITFVSGEASLTMHGYSPTVPTVAASDGSIGPVNYNSSTRLFSFIVSPGQDGLAKIIVGK